MSDDPVSGWKPWASPGGTWQGEGLGRPPPGYDASMALVTPGDTGTTTYLASAIAARMLRSGGTMNGPLILSRQPGEDMEATCKSYVDAVATGAHQIAAISLPISGGTMIGFLTLNADPQQPLEAATKQYADAGAAAATVIANAASALAQARLALSGGMMTGPLVLSGDPSQALAAATKQYVDAATGGGSTAAANNSGRNRLRNGWMEIWQRGQGPFGAGYTADGWIVGASSGVTVACSVTGTSGAYGPPRYMLAASGTVPAAGWLAFMQRIEAAASFDLVGQTITVSFYGGVVVGAGSAQGSIQIFYPVAADNFSALTMIAQANVTLGAGPQRVSATFANLPAGVAGGLAVHFVCSQQTSSGSMNFNMTGAQVEISAAPTTLERRVFAQQMVENQRFYEVGNDFMSGVAATSGYASQTARFRSLKHGIPAMTITPSALSNVSSVTTANIASDAVELVRTIGSAGEFYGDVSWSASSEL